MTEQEFRNWLQTANASMLKQQKIMLVFQLFLTLIFVLFIINWLPRMLMVAGLLVAIAIYKKTFDELAYINLSVHSFELNLPPKESWYYQDPRYPSGVTLLKTTLAQIIKYNGQLGRRILFYMILAIFWYLTT